MQAGPTGDYRVVQFHPSLRCNLRCHHCYSVSGPNEQDALSVETLVGAVIDLKAEGYNGIGVSGGEPLLYDGLLTLLGVAKAHGMITTVTTNGMLLTPTRAESFRGLVDVIAVSVDGTAATHNRIRGSGHAFSGMQRGLRSLRDAGIEFGVIFTLTIANLDELAGVVEMAVAEGASLVQVHPLEEVGRAGDDLPGLAPDERELAYAFLEVVRLRELHENVSIHLDVADRGVLSGGPQLGFAEPSCATDPDAPLASMVAPVVLESDGVVVPLQHGFDRRFAIGDITRERFRDGAQRWRQTRQEAFFDLCRAVYDRNVPGPPDAPFFNWYGAVTRASSSFAGLSPEEVAVAVAVRAGGAAPA
jgi:MoaA/NifB/PqqE/SkfB family radical SAM enzyme